MMTDFQELGAWKEGHRLVLDIYLITKSFPKDEIFGLISQLRRAVVSITSNIAEGFGRQGFKEKTHFYSIARGSVTEVQNQLIIAKDVGYITKEVFEKIVHQAVLVRKIIHGLIKSSQLRY